MLESDYSSRFGELIDSVAWDIELPRDWSDYFDQQGQMQSFNGDVRTNQRRMVRTYGILWFEKSPSFCTRPEEPIGIYSRDFSRNGAGLLTPFEVYPEERIRIALPCFLLQLMVVRTRRITSKCYEVGTELIKRHDPDPAALV